MRGLDRRIKEQLTEKGYKVRSLVTHKVPGIGYITRAVVSHPRLGSSGFGNREGQKRVLYRINGKPAQQFEIGGLHKAPNELFIAHRRTIRETREKNPRYKYPPLDVGTFNRYERHNDVKRFDSSSNVTFNPFRVRDPHAIARFVERHPEGTISVVGYDQNGRFSIRGAYSSTDDVITFGGMKHMVRDHALVSRRYEERMPLGAFYDTVNTAHLLYMGGRCVLTAVAKNIRIYEGDSV